VSVNAFNVGMQTYGLVIKSSLLPGALGYV
jgi:hypothetical protein